MCLVDGSGCGGFIDEVYVYNTPHMSFNQLEKMVMIKLLALNYMRGQFNERKLLLVKSYHATSYDIDNISEK